MEWSCKVNIFDHFKSKIECELIIFFLNLIQSNKKKSFQRCQNCQSTLTFSQFIIFHIIKNRHQNPSENQLPQIFVKQIAIFVQYFEKSGKSTLKKTKQISFDSFDSLKFFFYDVLMSLLEWEIILLKPVKIGNQTPKCFSSEKIKNVKNVNLSTLN